LSVEWGIDIMCRTMRKVVPFLFLLASGVASGAVEWRGLGPDRQLGGRKTSAGYLQGKVVLVCRWSPADAAAKGMLVRLEEIWQGFKTKPFVVLGGSLEDRGTAEEAKKLVVDSAVTFPVYAGAALGVGERLPEETPFLSVVDETGKVVYLGKDDRDATQALVTALTDMESPRDLEQWKRLLDFELETLPGRAYLRANAFRKKHPAEAKAYFEKFKALTSIPDVKRLSEFVAFSRKAKDLRTFDPKKKAVQKQRFEKMVESAISKYGSLAESEDPRVAQEAKNALADLKWTLAAL